MIGNTRVRTIALAISVAGLLIWSAGERHDMKKLRKLAIVNRDRTEIFTEKIEQLIALVSRSPQTPVVLEVRSPHDIEGVGSVARFLYTGGVDNPLQIHLVDVQPSMYTDGSLEHALSVMLEEWMRDGNSEYGLIPYALSGGERFTIRMSSVPKNETNPEPGTYSIHP
jgi:hypothetical protein